MPRPATSAFLTELEAQLGARPFLLIEAMFDGDPWRTWTGIGALRWNGYEWLGTGTLVTISPPTESSSGRAEGLTIQFSGGDGVDPSKFIANLLATHVQGRAVRVWWGFMNETGGVILDPLLIFSGFMDQPRIRDRGNECTIQMQCETEMIDQARAIKYRLSPARLQERSPGDRGFDYVSGIADINVAWPRAGFDFG